MSEILQGKCLWFTGLFASGKTTIAKLVKEEIENKYSKPVTLLDSHRIRQNLSKGLGFSQKDRNINIQRVGFVAKEIVKHNGIVICSLISPYNESRRAVRNLFQPGDFVEIYTKASLETCISRDTQDLYSRALGGEIPLFTGVNDPYEEPVNQEITLDTEKLSPEESKNIIINYLLTNK